ncbi:MAG TPA: glycosyltransferase family 4 protein [Candidatus Acidoferrales bacterium]|nr:glycosyltransferase family 4 protein [Candidatus Acidoferrales bacterium]
MKLGVRVVAVFGHTPEVCARAVAHVRAGAPETPIWLFTTVPPLAQTEAICAKVCVNASAFALLRLAQRMLWPLRAALCVAPWTGDGAPLPLRLAPFLIPPFRALFLNAAHDFLPGTPARVMVHNWRNLRDAVHSGWARLADIAGGCWKLVSYHIWRSGPVVRTKDLARAYWALVSYHVWRSGPVVRVKDLACGWSLWTAATFLRCLAYPHRRWFHRLHGDAALPLAAGSEPGSGVAVFVQRGRQWRGRELEKFARASSARFILWRQDGVVEDAGDMLPLFDDERTFAVGRQVDYRGWKPQIAVSAPFRTLQPGEATRVLAPLSRALLVDRARLLALGIPNCSLPGAAWLLLFWKAAAAGWRSYTVGQHGLLKPQPDCPMEETSFLLHVLWDRSLRQLGPSEPGLSAGNIAFQPALSRAIRSSPGRLRVLVVSPFLPFPLSHGGAVRIYNLCRSLQDRVDFALAAVREKNERVDYARLYDVFREVRVVDLDERVSSDGRLPRQVRGHQSRSLRALIGEMTRTWQPDLLQVEYTHMASFGDCAPGVPAILVEHDLTFSLYRQLAESRNTPEARREYDRWRTFERAWLRTFHGVWTVSEEDRAAAIAESGRAPELTFSVPNGVDTARFVPRYEPAEEPEILYVGSFRHLPNLIGFQALREHVMPRVWQRHPKVRLRVVAGPRHEEFWKGTVDPRIVMHGFVEDLRPLYARASAVAVPLAVSAGTNIKVLEAMACGQAIVSTVPGCAGLGLEDGGDLLIRDGWPEFAAALCQVLDDDALKCWLGANARATAEQRFSWDAIAGQAWSSYVRLSGLGGRPETGPAQRPAGLGAGVDAVFHDHRAVDDHVPDP